MAEEVKKTKTKTKKTAEPKATVKSAEKAPEKKTETKRANALEISVYGADGKETKTVELPKEIFDVEASPRLIAQYVRVYLANQRQGTASTKTRSEVTASTRKIYRQKGTGGARHGSRKAPIFVGGGVAFGPHPTDHSLKMNKKQKRRALFAVLSLKAKEGAISALSEEMLSMKPKTKTVQATFKTLGMDKVKIMMIISKFQENGLLLSVRNLPNIEIVSATSVNPYTLLNNNKIVFTEDALAVFTKQFTK
jgi:large subunit ribosomal protein L4